MASSQYDYDEEGETWPFFIISVLSMVLIPVTISSLLNLFSRNNNLNIKGALQCDKSEINSYIKTFRLKNKSSKLFSFKYLFIILGWGLLAYLCMNTKDSSYQITFDPYAILDVSLSTSEKDIKSRYRKLSLKFHPDKISNDLTDEVKKTMEDNFIKINQAYKALTDEDTKKNFLLYGHPDGPQDVSRGIALPKFLVEGTYSSLVIVFYVALIGVFLPLVVGSWWSRAKTYTKKGIHVDTAATFVRKLVNFNPALIVTPTLILGWLVESEELKTKLPNYSSEELLALIQEYMQRDFTSKQSDKLSAVSVLPKLIGGLIDIAGAFRQTDVVINTIELQKCILQAVEPNGKHQQLLQLPNVDREIVNKSPVKTLGKLFTLTKEDIGATLGITDEAKLQQALQMGSQIPLLTILSAEFKVPGESVVPPSSLAHIVIKVLVRTPLHKGESKFDKSKLNEEETLDSLREPFKICEDQPDLPISFTPYFPNDVIGGWVALLVLQRDGKLADTPSYFHKLDLSNLTLAKDEFINGEKVTIGTFKIKIESPSPPTVGVFPFKILLKNTSYFGSDYDIPIVMDVKEPPQIEEVQGDVYDIPDPDEDSIAGTLAQLRGESVNRESDDEEDSEGEFSDDEVFTDIDTDTEDESDEKK